MRDKLGNQVRAGSRIAVATSYGRMLVATVTKVKCTSELTGGGQERVKQIVYYKYKSSNGVTPDAYTGYSHTIGTERFVVLG